MSSPAPPRSSGAVPSTRQQLDELDALLDRMLVLPVEAIEEDLSPVEEIAPAPGPVVSSDITEQTALDGLAAGAEAQVVSFRVATVDTDAPERPATASFEGIQEGTSPSAELLSATDLSAPPEPVRDKPQAAAALGLAQEAEEPSPIIAEVGRGRAQRKRRGFLVVLLWPIRCINWIFDACTGWLGPVGGWLRGSQGRAFLGLAGLLLLAAALALGVVDWLRWTW